MLPPAPNVTVTVFREPRIVNLLHAPVNVTLLLEPATRAAPPSQSKAVVWPEPTTVAPSSLDDAMPGSITQRVATVTAKIVLPNGPIMSGFRCGDTYARLDR